MARGTHRRPGRRDVIARLRSDLAWCEADRDRLAEDNRELRRQLRGLQRELGTEEQTLTVPLVRPDGVRTMVKVTRPHRPSWALADL